MLPNLGPGSAPPPVPVAANDTTPRLKRPGGGDTFDGMEARVAKLEAHMEHVRADLEKLRDVPANLADLKATVANLPTKDWVSERLDKQLTRITWTIGGFSGALAIVTAIVGLAVRFL